MLSILLHRFNSEDEYDVYNCNSVILEQIIEVLGADNYVDPKDFAGSKNCEGWFITVDDGNSTDLELARFLSSRAMRAVFFINPGLIGGVNYASIEELRLIETLGHYIANHSFSHLNLIKLNNTEIFDQIRLAKEWIQKNGFNQLNYFAYPWGRNNFAIRRQVKNMGYEVAFGVTARKFDDCSPRGVLPRLAVTSSFDIAQLHRVLAMRNFGHAESWFREIFRILQTCKSKLDI